MKKLLLLVALFCISGSAVAQDFPYSKILNYTKADFMKNNFKYDAKNNCYYLHKSEGLQTTLNVLSIIAGSTADIRPGEKDYTIIAQLGEEDQIAYVHIEFYQDNTYHRLLTFAKGYGQNIIETSSGKLTRHQFDFNGYEMVLSMDQHKITTTSTRTSYEAAKSYDESYNEYNFIIDTGVKPTSMKLSKIAAKEAKRDAKGKKKRDVEDLM